MIQMNFKNADGKTSFTICNKVHADAFVWKMNEKGFVWVSTDILWELLKISFDKPDTIL